MTFHTFVLYNFDYINNTLDEVYHYFVAPCACSTLSVSDEDEQQDSE